jgi:hypothetical protein
VTSNVMVGCKCITCFRDHLQSIRGYHQHGASTACEVWVRRMCGRCRVPNQASASSLAQMAAHNQIQNRPIGYAHQIYPQPLSLGSTVHSMVSA